MVDLLSRVLIRKTRALPNAPSGQAERWIKAAQPRTDCFRAHPSLNSTYRTMDISKLLASYMSNERTKAHCKQNKQQWANRIDLPEYSGTRDMTVIQPPPHPCQCSPCVIKQLSASAPISGLERGHLRVLKCFHVV